MSSRFLPCAMLLAACATAERQQADDFASVRTDVRERAAVEIPSPRAEDGRIASEVRALLADELTEDVAVKIAVLNNRRVRAALAELDVSSAELVQAGLLRNPVFSANAKFFDEGTEVELALLQPFLDLFFVSTRKRTAASELAATKARVASEIVHVAYDVRRAFVEVRAAERLCDADRDALRAATASHELMRELHRAGNVTDPVFTAEVLALGRAKLAAARSEAELAEAREPLNVLLGLWGDAVEWKIAPENSDAPIAPPDLEHVESRAVEVSFDLAEGRARTSVEAARAGLAAWESAFSSGELGLVAKRESLDDEWGLGPALVFDLPIFDAGGTAQAAAQGRLRASLAEHVALAVEIRSAARTLRDRASALESEAAFLGSDVVPASQRLVEDTLRNYNAMQIGVFDVLAVKEREIAARRDHIERTRDARLARLDLLELLAGHLNRERVAAQPDRSLSDTATSAREGH